MRFKRYLNGHASSRVLFAALALLFTFAAVPASAAGTLLISEFRVRGPGGASDEFIEIYNNSGADHTVASISGTGYAIAASDGVVRCTIPDGTIIPQNGHYLCTNSTSYSYSAYPAGSGTTATGDATYATDIPDQSGVALFNNNTGGGSFTLANRFDAVGPTGEALTLYREGAGLPALTPFSIEYAWVRDACGKGGAVNLLTQCTISTPKDTDDNAADFYFVDTNGTSAGGGQRLAAPGPENLSSPVSGTSSISNTPLDTCAGSLTPATPNFVRDLTSVPASNSTFGTIDIRRTFTNNTGGNLTRLRFRIIDLDTFPAASGFADLRPITSSDLTVNVDRPPCGSGTGDITVHGTTLEQDTTAPSTGQPNGGGFNSTMGAGTVTLGTPLANGASVDLRFLFGIQQTGNFRVGFVIEGLPKGGGAADFLFLECSTDGPACVAPAVSSIVRAGPNPTVAASVDYTVTFSQSVTGVDVADFALTTTGTIAGASVTGVSGSGTTYTVTVNTGAGAGTIRLDVADNDTIVNGTFLPLGDTGLSNGNFTTGEAYTIDHACGDGIVVAGVEECDDGNTVGGDGCDAACQIEVTPPAPTCGDGTVDPGETCDDSNTVSGDGCDAACQVEEAAAPVCGDGTVDTGEGCDDGNTTDGDGCSAACAVETANDLSCANPGVTFSSLTEGKAVGLSAPDSSCGGPTALIVKMQNLPSTCTCAWSVNPSARGSFSNASACATVFTPGPAGTGQMTVDVDCGAGATGTFLQTLVVNARPASGGGCSLIR